MRSLHTMSLLLVCLALTSLVCCDSGPGIERGDGPPVEGPPPEPEVGNDTSARDQLLD